MDELGDGEEVVTEALRALRRSALCCRRARLLIEDHDLPCIDLADSAGIRAATAR
jgi:hypothetical protein